MNAVYKTIQAVYRSSHAIQKCRVIWRKKKFFFWEHTKTFFLWKKSGHEGDVWCVDLDRHRIVAGGRHGEVRIWGRENTNTERSIWVHSRSTAVGKIKLEPAVLITTDGLGSIVISDFWKCQKTTCGCEK